MSSDNLNKEAKSNVASVNEACIAMAFAVVRNDKVKVAKLAEEYPLNKLAAAHKRKAQC